MQLVRINRLGISNRVTHDPDALAWANAVALNGGSTSADRLGIVSRFIIGEKMAGIWSLTDDYLGLWAENAPQALTSLKQRRLAIAVNSPVFIPDRHFQFDGATNYVDTGFIAETHALSMSLYSVHQEIYERVILATSGNPSMGVSSGSNRVHRVIARTSGNVASLSFSGGAATYNLPAATNIGLTQGGRRSSALADVYGCKNGVAMVQTADPTVLGTQMPLHSYYISGWNSAGTASSLRASAVGYAAWGAKLTEAQCLARYNNVQAWATAVGAQV